MQERSHPLTLDTDKPPVENSPDPLIEAKPTLFERIGGFFQKLQDGEMVEPGPEPLELTGPVRIAWSSSSFKLGMGGEIDLEIHPDLPITGISEGWPREWIIHAGGGFREGIPRFLSVCPESS